MLDRVRAGPPSVRDVVSGGAALIAVAVIAFALFMRVRSDSAVASAGQTYSVDYRVPAKVLSAAQVADIVEARLMTMGGSTSAPKVLRMTVVPLSAVASVELGAGSTSAGSPEADAVVWVVRAEGTFIGTRVPPGAKPIVGSTGYFILDDATGDVIGMGIP